MHEFTLLVRAENPTFTLGDSQGYANNEVLSLAREMVNRGCAKWKQDIDEEGVLKLLRSWQNEKNATSLQTIFGMPSLTGPSKKIIKD